MFFDEMFLFRLNFLNNFHYRIYVGFSITKAANLEPSLCRKNVLLSKLCFGNMYKQTV